MLGLGVVNADEPDSLGTNARDPAVAAYNVAAQKRAAAQRAARDPSHPPQEYDAGRWTAEAQDAVQAMASIPPSYDPSWAGDYPLMTPQPTGTDSGRRVSSRTRPSTISDITPMELDETPVDTPPGELVTEASPGPYTPQSDRTN
jgi:hypothetical protein